MSALAIPVPAREAPAAHGPPRHLQLVGPGFVPPAGSVSERAEAPTPAADPRPAIRLTARGRLVRSVLVLVVATGLAIAGGAWLGGAVAGGQHAYSGAVEQVSVAAGDTMWAIAAASAAPGQDVRDVVDDILDLNGLSSGELAVGQQLLVPAG